MLVAGGVGITPMMSIARYLTERSWVGDIFFLYTCRSPADFIFADDISALQRLNPKLHVAGHDLRHRSDRLEGSARSNRCGTRRSSTFPTASRRRTRRGGNRRHPQLCCSRASRSRADSLEQRSANDVAAPVRLATFSDCAAIIVAKVVVAPSGEGGSLAHSAVCTSLIHFAPGIGFGHGTGAGGSAVIGRA